MVDPPDRVVSHASTPHHRTLSAVLLLAVAAATLFALATPSRAEAADACYKAVVADWYGDGRVDKLFPLHCYRDAIRSLPVDVKVYSNAEEDILRALAFAKKGQKDPGDAGTGGSSGGGGSGTGGNGTGGSGTGGNGTGGNGGTDTVEPTDPGETIAGPDVDTSGPSSIPLPLLVLGGLALLLLAAGGAGYLNRRLQARRGDGDVPPGVA